LHTGVSGIKGRLTLLRAIQKKEIRYHVVYYHFRKWSLKKVVQHSMMTIRDDLNLSELNLAGSHVIELIQTFANEGRDSASWEKKPQKGNNP
jgi:hypothetical protein